MSPAHAHLSVEPPTKHCLAGGPGGGAAQDFPSEVRPKKHCLTGTLCESSTAHDFPSAAHLHGPTLLVHSFAQAEPAALHTQGPNWSEQWGMSGKLGSAGSGLVSKARSKARM